MMVSQSGMWSRSPGATSLPSRPMIVPADQGDDDRPDHDRDLLSSGEPPMAIASLSQTSAAEADLARDAAADLDVRELGGRHEDARGPWCR